MCNNEDVVGIVIVNYNGLKDTLECIESIKSSKTRYSIRIIIVDNCSKNDELEIIEKKYKDVIKIRSDFNGGFSYGNNLGISWAIKNNCDYIMLLNNDTIIKDDMIDVLIDSCNSQIVAPTMLYYGTKDLVWYAGGCINKKTGNAEHKHIGERVNVEDLKKEICSFTTGCCLAASTETIKKIGYLDDSYFMYCEDTDYCIRAALKGIQIEYIPKAILWHKVSQSTGGSESPFATYYMTRNRLNYVKKYKNYFRMEAYLFSVLSRFIRMLQSKDTRMQTAFRDAIQDHFKGQTGRRY